MSALQLEVAAHLLGPILDEVVFDVICEVASRAEYYRLGEKLRERGMQEAVD